MKTLAQTISEIDAALEAELAALTPDHCAHCALYYWRLSEMYMSLQWPRREQAATRRAYHYDDDAFCGPQFASDYHTMIENDETFFLD